MGSSFYSPFLLQSLLSGKMSLKVIVLLCLVMVGLLEANPVGMEGPEEHDNTVSGGSMSEEMSEEMDDMRRDGGDGGDGERKKREWEFVDETQEYESCENLNDCLPS